MKVLWFTNTPSLAEEKLSNKPTGGGWIKALERRIKEECDLHVAFYFKSKLDLFEYNNTKYHPIILKNNYYHRIKKHLFSEVLHSEHLPIYLKLIDKIKPDIIHIHGTENPFGYIIGETEIPVVVSIQGNITVYLHKYFSGIEKKYLRIKGRKRSNFFTSIFRTSFKKHYQVFKKMQKREVLNLKNCSYVIGRTDWDKRISRVLAPKSKYFKNNEILRESFYKSVWKQPNSSSFVIHTTNGNTFYKGFETICYTLNILNNLGFQAIWKVAGIKHTDLIVKVVKKKLGKNYPETGLRLLGKTDEKGILKELLSANIYVMPSHIENSPNNLCEAMIIGMPCIASYSGGTGSLIENGKDGILIQDGDPWSCAGTIIELYKDQIYLQKIAKNARVTALERHNPEKIVKQIMNIYGEIING